MEEIGTDLIVGAVDLIVTVATAGAVKGGSLMSVAKAELKTLAKTSIRAAVKQTVRQTAATTVREAAEAAAKRPLAARLASGIGKTATQFAKGQAHQLAVSLPTTIASNLLNERNLRNGNPLHNIARGTFDASIQNLKMGVAMGAAGHALQSSLSHFTVVTKPTLSPVQTRLAEYKTWKADNPGRPGSEFVAHMEARQVAVAQGPENARLEVREARRGLLSEIPPRERAGFVDVPIVRVSEGEFRALNGGAVGDAMIHVHQGQTAVVIREGAPLGAARALSGELRERVAPGTAGRTVNPAEALPPRLQNRVKVEIVDIPELGLSGARAVPEFHPDGHIIGVKLEVGPNARAVDIQQHLETVDAMRKLTGLSGRARLIGHEVARSLGIDIISPIDRGRWEAALEIRKLRGVIDERVMRLAEEGVDRRSRGRINDEIADLRQQLDREVARFAQGKDAEARGYVAAEDRTKGRGKSDKTRGSAKTAVAEEPKPAARQAAETRPAPTPEQQAQRARQSEILNTLSELNSQQAQIREALDAQAGPHAASKAEFTERFNPTKEALSALQRNPELPQTVRAELRKLSIDMVAFQEIFSRLAESGSLPDLIARSGVRGGRQIAAMQEIISRQKAFVESAAALNSAEAAITAKRAALNEEFSKLKGVDRFNPHDPGQLSDPNANICLACDTPVWTPAGVRPIDSIVAGEWVSVLGGPSNGEGAGPAQVDRTITGHADAAVVVRFEDDSSIVTTREHRIRAMDPERWLPARLLHPGVVVSSRTGPLMVTSAILMPGHLETRNLVVIPGHVYLAGIAGVVVHNGEPEESKSWTNLDPHDTIIYGVVAKAKPSEIIDPALINLNVKSNIQRHVLDVSEPQDSRQ